MKVVLDLFVPGRPQQQGSKTPGVAKDGHAYMRESNATALRAWRKAVRTAAVEAWGGQIPLDEPIYVGITFLFPAIKSERAWMTSAPDLDKLERAVLDSLTAAKVYVDDARVCRLNTAKFHHPLPRVPRPEVQTVPTQPGARIIVGVDL